MIIDSVLLLIDKLMLMLGWLFKMDKADSASGPVGINRN